MTAELATASLSLHVKTVNGGVPRGRGCHYSCTDWWNRSRTPSSPTSALTSTSGGKPTPATKTTYRLLDQERRFWRRASPRSRTAACSSSIRAATESRSIDRRLLDRTCRHLSRRRIRTRRPSEQSFRLIRVGCRCVVPRYQHACGSGWSMRGEPPGGTSKYVTHTSTSVVPRFAARCTCPWPRSTND